MIKTAEKKASTRDGLQKGQPDDRLSFAASPKNLGDVLSHAIANQRGKIADVPGREPSAARRWLDTDAWRIRISDCYDSFVAGLLPSIV
jgi:hypothetical protein